jgi:hypothetical protein
MKLPTKIRIVGSDYKVIPSEAGELKAMDHIGECNYLEHTIRIKKGLIGPILKNTMLHETVHGISNELCLGLEERQVELLTTGLIAVLKDNPKFKDWLLNDNK